jgi:aspartate racemase
LVKVKKIGIIGGMSPESTIEYYKILVKEYNKMMGGVHGPSLMIESLDLEPLRKWMVADEWQKVYQTIFKGMKNLIAGGAEWLLMATNTPHMVYDQLRESVPKPIISIMDATAIEIKKKNIKTVGLLGTKFTMEKRFYKEALAKHDIVRIVPEEKERDYINRVIWEELCLHKITPEAKKGYLKIIDQLKQRGAEGIILGCTEIPLLIQQKDTTLPVFDTTTIHAKRALQLAME